MVYGILSLRERVRGREKAGHFSKVISTDSDRTKSRGSSMWWHAAKAGSALRFFSSMGSLQQLVFPFPYERVHVLNFHYLIAPVSSQRRLHCLNSLFLFTDSERKSKNNRQKSSTSRNPPLPVLRQRDPKTRRTVPKPVLQRVQASTQLGEYEIKYFTILGCK